MVLLSLACFPCFCYYCSLLYFGLCLFFPFWRTLIILYVKHPHAKKIKNKVPSGPANFYHTLCVIFFFVSLVCCVIISESLLLVIFFRRIYLNGNLQLWDPAILNLRVESIMDGSSCLQNTRSSHLLICC